MSQLPFAPLPIVGNALSAFTTPYAQDLIGIFNSDGIQVLRRARPLKLTVSPSAKLPEHPLETGGLTTDHIIFLPIVIEISVILQSADYRSTYQEILQLFQSAALLTVQTKTNTYTNQVIMSPPHEENTDFFDAVPLILKLQQFQFVNTSQQTVPIAPKDPKNSDTVNRGTQQTTPASAGQSGLSEIAFGAKS